MKVLSPDKQVLVYLLHEKAPPRKATMLKIKLGRISFHYWLIHPTHLPLLQLQYDCESLQEVLEEVRDVSNHILAGLGDDSGRWFEQWSLTEAGLDDSSRTKG